MADFLYEYVRELSTGNTVADHFNLARLSMQPEYWGLINYLAEKGVLDEREFAAFLGQHLKAQVTAIDQVAQEQEIE